MSVPYSFSVLRYVYDPVSAEFVNIGVAVYSVEARFFDAICTPHYGRISKLFEPIEGDYFRQVARHIQGKIGEIGYHLKSELPFAPAIEDIAKLLAQIRPPDDSALQFSQAGGGISSDSEKTLSELYDRYVDRFTVRKVTNLVESDERFRLHILLGQPRDTKLQNAFVKAKKILHKIPGKPEFIQENEADQFAESLKKGIEQHGE